MPGYLNPVSDDDSGSYTPTPTSNNRSTSVPAVTTRGQLSYGGILAANREGEDHVTPYYSSTLTFPDSQDKKKEVKQENAPLPQRNLPSVPSDASNDVFRFSSLSNISDDGLDEYEQPISANSSLRYATIDNNEPPKTFAPAVPTTEPLTTTADNSQRKKSGVKVLPSNPFAALQTTRASNAPQVSPQPKPQPRKKREQKSESGKQPSVAKATDSEKVKRDDAAINSNRDSHMSTSSTKSIHHYFVLEPENNSEALDDYENSVSSPRIV